MKRAFVLITTELGAEAEVLDSLEEISEVVEAHRVLGFYSIFIRVEAETMQELKEIVTQRIEPLNKVQATTTMTCLDPESDG